MRTQRPEHRDVAESSRIELQARARSGRVATVSVPRTDYSLWLVRRGIEPAPGRLKACCAAFTPRTSSLVHLEGIEPASARLQLAANPSQLQMQKNTAGALPSSYRDIRPRQDSNLHPPAWFGPLTRNRTLHAALRRRCWAIQPPGESLNGFPGATRHPRQGGRDWRR